MSIHKASDSPSRYGDNHVRSSKLTAPPADPAHGARLLHFAEDSVEVVRLMLVKRADVLDVPQLLAVAREVLGTDGVLVRIQPVRVLGANVLRSWPVSQLAMPGYHHHHWEGGSKSRSRQSRKLSSCFVQQRCNRRRGQRYLGGVTSLKSAVHGVRCCCMESPVCNTECVTWAGTDCIDAEFTNGLRSRRA